MTAYQGTMGLLPCSGAEQQTVPCQLRDSIQQPFSYWPNTLTTRLPATPAEMPVSLSIYLRGHSLQSTTHFLKHNEALSQCNQICWNSASPPSYT